MLSSALPQPSGLTLPRCCAGGDLSLLMDMEPSYCMADPMEGTHRGGMLRPSMHPIKPQPAMVPCCTPQHPKTPPQPILKHRCGPMHSLHQSWVRIRHSYE